MNKRVVLLTAAGLDADIRAVKTAQSLTAAGYTVTVLSGRDTGACPARPFTVRSYEKIYHADASVGRKLGEKLGFFRWIVGEVRREKPEIVHACNLDMLAAAQIACGKCAKVVYDSYEICTEKEGLVSQSRLIHSLAVRAERHLLPKANAMLCVSGAAQAYFEKTYPGSAPEVVTNAPRRETALPHGHALPLRVAYIGRYGKNRGIEELLEGVLRLPPETAVAELRGFGALEGLVREKEAQSKGQIRLCARIAPEKIHAVLQEASVGAVLTKPTSLNHRLTVSNKLFDYLHAGLPVLMSDVEEHRRLNGLYDFGIILPKVTAEAVERALLRLAEDGALYERLSRNACAAAQELNWEGEEKKLLAVYAGLTEERNGGGV